MIAAIIHRYTIPIAEIAELLAGVGRGNAEACTMRIDGDDLIVEVDVSGMSGERMVVVPTDFDHEKLCSMIEAGEFRPGAAPPTSKRAPVEKADPERKGGQRARRAAMLCDEGGFQKFIEVETADAAKAEIYRRCGIESRADLDHDEDAGRRWDQIVSGYQLWLSGY